VCALLGDWEYEKVVLASVVPANVPALVEAQAGRPLVELSHRIELGIAIDFPDPSKIGADRLANAVAVAARRPDGPVIVVDFGTAVTFDIIDARPAYIGGVIAPGLDAMRHYLHERTALLPEIEIARPPSAIGKSTVHAMQSGAYHGYRGLVLEILARIHEEMGGPAKTIATGGYAALIADGLPAIGSVEPHLTMQGLLRVAELNFPQ
jgi:type III pantothenate kinase